MDKVTFAKKQYFNGDWETYLVTGGNTFDIKDQLKAAGFKFTKELNWHSPDKLEVPEGYELTKVTFDQCFDEDFNVRAEVRTLIKPKKDSVPADPALEPYKDSEFIGEVGERLRNLTVTFISKKMVETPFGMNYRIVFEYSGNLILWFTSSASIDNFEIGDSINFAGTVKAHKTYGDINQTVITRGYLKPIS